MKILITGAGGLVGRHLAEFYMRGHEVAAFGHRELDITDSERVFEKVKAERPDVIYNCAVLGVDECERDPQLAFAVNIAGPKNIASAASAIGAEVVHFSTNYVFDGEKESGYYTIYDEPRPINIYGRSKLEGEQSVLTACERSYVIRTSWVFGKGKQTFFSTVHGSLGSGKPVEALSDMRAGAAYVIDLVRRIAEIIARKRCGTYQVVNAGTCSRYEFALEASRILGIPNDHALRLIKPVQMQAANQDTPRPKFTPMYCKMSEQIGLIPLRDWREALSDYIQN